MNAAEKAYNQTQEEIAASEITENTSTEDPTKNADPDHRPGDIREKPRKTLSSLSKMLSRKLGEVKAPNIRSH